MPLAFVGAITAPLAALLWLCGAVVARRRVGSDAAGYALRSGHRLFARSRVRYALVAGVGLTATNATLAGALAAAALAWRQRLWRARIDRRELPGLMLCAAVTLLWCRHSAEAPAVLARTGVLPVWVDYLIHGVVISGFGDALADGRQSIDPAGFPQPFYHYAWNTGRSAIPVA